MSSKIDHNLFSAHEHALEREPCPKCGGEVSLKHGKHGPFLGCSQYPSCDYIKPLHSNDGHIVKELGVPCPECGNELVLRQGRYGMFVGCSHYPACHHIESINQPEPQQQAKEQHACPECGKGHLVERKTRFGKTFYACDNYPKCKFAVNLPPVRGRCEECGFTLLVEKKLASGVKLQCASRKCQHTQSQ
ncbi:DNA topoisomerase family protein [Vibrio campbellii]|jgi:putative DNA topoisomerase|uniref:DNA topoisomerase n=3 Tax=Vibrio harveyi group TaxID=717610 RepID=A0ABX3D9W0_9VIBR|nr:MULTISPECIES: topoisomerase DNA-binding C4 zinc finger domain-containing protein [Vibrio]MED5504974.1 topoisomerase DNA-binding C4 zinc finger domain-containing protein [Pseudomonadota bacterium]ARR07927.1 DNA topoisomerase A [Vibrio campbellii]ARV71295.1 DNA topoisomerase [Vibrio campbellii CAIM 519 = NBRC 15631 = ATCC 25920]ASI97831.1 DNA topoisomerase [Vibrio rotiferianus]AUW03446.1 DNA topoisomerase [Vibrio campbellii]|tara:strand:+ start:1192 stop:1761 length:570 start_codon:yes stop_codon:yes gene_type:complete